MMTDVVTTTVALSVQATADLLIEHSVHFVPVADGTRASRG